MDIIIKRSNLEIDIAICIFTPTPLRHEKLKRKMIDFTEFYVKRIVELQPEIKYYIVDSIDEGMEKYHTTHDHILFLACGVRTYDDSIIYDIIDMVKETQKPGNQAYLAGAHILDWKEDWYELHHQFILVNSNSWRKCNKPFFGSFNPGVIELPIIERSEENFHHDYTPYWIKYTGSTEKRFHSKQGWNYIKVGLTKGYQILNWDKTIRDKRTYYYPESDSELFYNCLINREYDESLNINQRKLLKIDQDVDKHVWLLNSERLDIINESDLNKYEPFKKIFLPAAGLKFLSAYKQNMVDEETKFIFFDFSDTSLDWLFHLYSHESFDIPQIIQDFEDKDLLRIKGHLSIISHTGDFIQDFYSSLERSINALGGEEKFKEYLHLFRKTKPLFIKCDLINNPERIIKLFAPSNNFINISNIFCTDYSNTFLNSETIVNSFNNLLTLLPKDTYFTGFDPGNKFYSNIIDRETALNITPQFI